VSDEDEQGTSEDGSVDVAATLDRLEAKIDRLARQNMTPGQAAAEARRLMANGYQQEAERRAREAEEAATGGEA
jgi:hypothetical protein